jgi:hypothetical protein
MERPYFLQRSGVFYFRRLKKMDYGILISPLPTHGEKRQLMVPGGQFMAENDMSWREAIRCKIL